MSFQYLMLKARSQHEALERPLPNWKKINRLARIQIVYILQMPLQYEVNFVKDNAVPVTPKSQELIDNHSSVNNSCTPSPLHFSCKWPIMLFRADLKTGLFFHFKVLSRQIKSLFRCFWMLQFFVRCLLCDNFSKNFKTLNARSKVSNQSRKRWAQLLEFLIFYTSLFFFVCTR